MHILVIGAGGMLGGKLVQHLASTGHVGGQAITKITRHDVGLSPTPPMSSSTIETLMGDVSREMEANQIIALKPDVIFHLAAVVSGEA